MNDLEPWKIWVVTAALVCLILGSTAARVRSMDAVSGAAAPLLSAERSSDAAAAPAASATDQYEAYAPPLSHRSYGSPSASVESYPRSIASSALPVTAPFAYQQAASPEGDELEVSRQLFASEDSQAVDANSTTYWGLPLDAGLDDQTLASIPPPVSEGGWMYASISDENTAESTLNFFGSVDGAELVDDLGADIVHEVNLGRYEIAAGDDSGSSEAVTLLGVPGTGYGNGYPVPEGAGDVADIKATYKNLALYDVYQETQTADLEAIQAARAEALAQAQNEAAGVALARVQAEALQAQVQDEAVQAQAEAQLAAAQQQRAMAAYSLAITHAYAQLNGAYPSQEPQE